MSDKCEKVENIVDQIEDNKNQYLAQLTHDQHSDLNLRIRVVKMTVVWTACSFSCHFLNIMNKYLEGSIFTNNYVEGLAGGVACYFAAQVYAKHGVRTSFIISFGMCLFGSFIVYLLESGYLQLPQMYLSQFEGTHKH